MVSCSTQHLRTTGSWGWDLTKMGGAEKLKPELTRGLVVAKVDEPESSR